MKTLRVHSAVREFRAAQRRLFVAGRTYGRVLDGLKGNLKSIADVEDAEDALQDAAIEFAFAAANYADAATIGVGRALRMPAEPKS